MRSESPFRAVLPAILLASLALVLVPARPVAAQAFDPSNPASVVKLVFVHHSTGENWLNDSNGQLGLALRNASYFVSDTYYDWGPADLDAGGTLGDHTDVGNFYSWFAGPHSATYLAALYPESGQHSSYSRLATDPGGENLIVMFKSCFPNSNFGGAVTDPVPPIGSNPLRHQDAYSPYHTFANAKGIYQSLLTTFAARQDKLFVLVTTPPLVSGDTSPEVAAVARALNDWLAREWLADYPHKNVFVFDFYSVLTSNGGTDRNDDPDTNDLGWADGNHHRFRNGAIERIRTVSYDMSAYWTGDSHPSEAGNLKATGEFVSLLNIAYHCWQGTGACPRYGLVAPASRFHPVTPCRILDTRDDAGPFGGPALEAAGGTDRSVPVVLSACGIPPTATAVSANVAAVTPGVAGDLLVYPGHLTDPGPAATLSFPAAKTRATGSTLWLAADGTGTVKVRNRAAGAVDFLLDVNGYFTEVLPTSR